MKDFLNEINRRIPVYVISIIFMIICIIFGIYFCHCINVFVGCVILTIAIPCLILMTSGLLIDINTKRNIKKRLNL